MSSRLASQLQEILNEPQPHAELLNDKPPRVAASMLRRAPVLQMIATTVVGALGRDDVDRFCGLVQEVADEYELEATITFHVGSFSVRFERGE
jgi:hypothetical protein